MYNMCMNSSLRASNLANLFDISNHRSNQIIVAKTNSRESLSNSILILEYCGKKLILVQHVLD